MKMREYHTVSRELKTAEHLVNEKLVEYQQTKDQFEALKKEFEIVRLRHEGFRVFLYHMRQTPVPTIEWSREPPSHIAQVNRVKYNYLFELYPEDISAEYNSRGVFVYRHGTSRIKDILVLHLYSAVDLAMRNSIVNMKFNELDLEAKQEIDRWKKEINQIKMDLDISNVE